MIATATHSTLPWSDAFSAAIELGSATPLSEFQDPGRRDAMSLLGQFAVHQAFLRFAAIDDGPFDASQWAVKFQRGKDCRLIRVRAGAREPQSAIDLIEQFASHFDLTALPVFRQSWTKPEAVYYAVKKSLRGDARADLSALRASATGAIVPPGAEWLRRLFEEGARGTWSDPSTIEAFERAASLSTSRTKAFVLGSEHSSPLRRYSAIQAVDAIVEPLDSLDASDVVDAILAAAEQSRLVFAVRSFDRFDAASLSVVRLLMRSADSCSWLVPAGSEASLGIEFERVSDARVFITSPRLSAAGELAAKLRTAPLARARAWLDEWVQGPGLSRFLDDGIVPEAPAGSGIISIPEPRLSYLGALSIVDRVIDLSVARAYLKEIGSNLPLEDLVVDGVTQLSGCGFEFIDEAARSAVLSAIPQSSVPRLAHVAGSLLEESGAILRAAELFHLGEDGPRALRLLERFAGAFEGRSEALVTQLCRFPLTLMAQSPVVAERLASALIDAGRYAEAGRLAPGAPSPARELLLARIERRLGNYAAALQQLDTIPEDQHTIDVLLLAAELQRLQGDLHAADALLGRCLGLHPGPENACRVGYETAMLAIDGGTKVDESWLTHRCAGDDYLAHRYDAYEAVARGDYEQAIESARAAFDCAEDFAKRVDAAVDLVYAIFLCGDWERARREARFALALVEETEGDRAAGGVLFTLAYLCADCGQWSQSAQMIERLRRFYAGTSDARRLGEIDLLRAHLDFCRFHFDEARAHANAIASAAAGGAIHEAACQILDDIDWVQCAGAPLRASGKSGCVELDDRYRVNVIRRGAAGDAHIHGGFLRGLAAWERSAIAGRAPRLPETESRSEEILLLRSLAGVLARRFEPGLAGAAKGLAGTLGIDAARLEARPAKPEPAEVRMLHALATASFPFGAKDLGEVAWRFVQRNRLGHWSEIGSLPPLAREELDRLCEGLPADWCGCSESSFAFIEGSGRWSATSRGAAAALFRIRSEHYRFARALEQDDRASSDAAPEPVDGVVGTSVVMRDLLAMIPRVARRDVAVCIQGESGTGKELIANAIHRASARRGKAFVAVNCAALPDNLIESELFGHARGAFTGADRDRPGLIETSDGGTLFLDEIGEMALGAQAKLLRFLQEGEFRRVGESANRTADVRIVVATNRKLEQAVDEGGFREDLYYRVRGVELLLPPLRDRGSDVVLLARHFVAGEHKRYRGGPDRLSPEVEQVFASYDWPGNVRELQHAIRAAHALAGDARQIDVEHLPARMRTVATTPVHAGNYFEELTRFRKSLVERSLKQAKGNQNQAAKLLGMSRQALSYQIRELGILVK